MILLDGEGEHASRSDSLGKERHDCCVVPALFLFLSKKPNKNKSEKNFFF